MRLKTIILVAGVLAPAFSVGAFMNLFSGFTVEREVVVGPRGFNQPRSLVRATDDGYFVIGQEIGAWASKIDSQGKALWTLEEPAQKRTAVHFIAAAAADDGGVLLCGRRDGLGERGLDSAGLVVRIDKNMNELSRIDPEFNNLVAVSEFIDTDGCSSWGNGFAVLGAARIEGDKSKGLPGHGISTLLRLKKDGTVLWQKNIQLKGTGYGSPYEMTDEQLLLVGDQYVNGVSSTTLTLINPNGDLITTKNVKSSCRLLANIEATKQVSLICLGDAPNLTMSLITLDKDLNVKQEREFSSSFRTAPNTNGFGLSRGYMLPDGSSILFGSMNGELQRFIPTIIEFGPDLSVTAKYEFIGANETGLADGLPGRSPGEFVVTRPSGESDQRTVVTFLHRKQR